MSDHRTRLELTVDERLRGAIHRQGLPPDRERVALSLVPLFVREVVKLVKEQIDFERRTHGALSSED